MSDRSTTRLIDAYLEQASAPLFLAGFFQTPPSNIHNTEKIELDVMRDGEDVAIVIEDMTAGSRENEATLYVNKGFTPPIFDEVGTITAYDQTHRLPGQNPFANPDYAFNATQQSFRIFRKLENKIRRAIELMASQVLQTGVITGIDQNGATLYTLDFVMKPSHKIAPTAWAADGSTGNPMGDLSSAGDIVRRDGKFVPDRLIFGTGAYQRFLANAKVQTALARMTGLGLGQLVPEVRGMGATYQGYIFIGNYRYEIWTYDGFYKHQQTGTLTPYIADNAVLMMSSKARLDLSFGAIPLIVPPDQRVLPFLPPRISSGEQGIDLTTNAWVTPDGKHLKVSAGTRPLTIPTAIDTYARLSVF
jgi:hypothetical protein